MYHFTERKLVGYCLIVALSAVCGACGTDDDDTTPAQNVMVDMRSDSGVVEPQDGGMAPQSDAMAPSADQGMMMQTPDAFLPTGTGTSPGRDEIIFEH